MSEKKIIERRLEPMDERMPLKQWYEVSRKQVDATPLEIVEDGITYKMFDMKQEINGYMNTAIVLYKEK